MHSFVFHQQARFSAAAPAYDRLARVQRDVAERLFRSLTYVESATRILDIGCGTGGLTRRLAKIWPTADIEGIDLAPGMIEAARQSNGTATRPTFIVADAATFTSDRPYDLLVSSSTLHWVQPLETTLVHLARLLAPGGRFVFAIMLEKTLRELHETRALVTPQNPASQRMPSNDTVLAALTKAGLLIEMNEEEERTTTSESATDLLRELHELGVTGGALARGTAPLTRRELQNLTKLYDEHHRNERGVFATYHVGHYFGSRDA